MVHSWVAASSSVSSITSHTKNSVRSGRTTKQSAFGIHNWRMARGLFFLFAFLVLFSGFTLMRTFAATDGVAPASSEDLIISIDSGDTLWEVANTYKKDTMDTREAVHYLLKRNGLSSSALRAGQTLIIPTRILPMS